MRLLLFVFLFGGTLAAQQFVPGQAYFDSTAYIEYHAGNLPIIISAPHGGHLSPTQIPDRNCSGCVYVKDANTQELARALDSAVFNLTGCYPHVVMNLLHRKKLDANRDIIEAADSNALAEQAWRGWHTFLENAHDSVTASLGRGILIDLHGHGHSIQRLELGYILSDTELQMADSLLDSMNMVLQSSIRQLSQQNLTGLSHSQLLRGPHSLGTYFELAGYPAVPSSSTPFPQPGDPYFDGGYNTQRYGSRDSGMIDAVQIECNMDSVRDSWMHYRKFADSTASVLIRFLERHYFGALDSFDCHPDLPIGIPPSESSGIVVFPNPVTEHFSIKGMDTQLRGMEITIRNLLGESLPFQQEILPGGDGIQIDWSVAPGVYFLEISTESGMIFTSRLIRRPQP